LSGSVTAAGAFAATSTFSGSTPADGVVVDYSTGFARFSTFGSDGFKWFNGGIGTTALMQIASSGGVSIGNTTDPGAANLSVTGTGKFGGLITAQSGIQFAGGTLTNTTLNAYEEGTWTPTFSSLTVTGSPTYSGRYTKIGRLVFVSWQITTGGTATTASVANTTAITNLPFTVASTAPGVMSVSSNNIKNIGVGMFYSGTTAYTPTWTSTTDVIYGSGCYTI
jgi:hypothetical protein